MTLATPSRLAFAGFLFDPETRELWRADGTAVPLAPKPSRALALLLETPGRLVTREQLQEHVWPETIIEFDQGLNTLIRQLRATLGDDAGAPRFIETVPRRGYRWIADIERPVAGDADPQPNAFRRHRRLAGLTVLGALGALTAYGWFIARGAEARAPAVRVAVLPFDAVGEFSAESLAAAGFTEALTARLGAVDPGRLHVIGPTSAARFDLRTDPPERIAAALDVDYLVTGSAPSRAVEARAAGSVIEPPTPPLGVRVLRARDGAVVWSVGGGASRTDARGSVAVPVSPAELAGAVAGAILSRPLVQPPAGVTREPADAVRLEWLMASHLLRRKRAADVERSIPLLHAVVATDPAFGPAHVAMAEAKTRLGKADEARSALAVARLAGASEAEAARVQGLLALSEWEVRAAVGHLETAVAGLPGDGTLLHTLAYAYALAGRHERAAAAMERVRALDPLSGAVHGDAGLFDLWAGRPLAAVEHCQRVLPVVEPADAPRAYRCLLEGRLAAGDSAGAQAEAVRILTARSAPAHVLLSVSESKPGDGLRRYFAWGADGHEVDTEGSSTAYARARALAAAADTAGALAALRTSFDRREARFVQLRVDPRFAGLRSLPGYRAILRRLTG